MATFLQRPPRLPDAWEADRVLRETALFYLGEELFARAEPDLKSMGSLATAPETLALARRAELEPPVHIPFTAWGERIDEIRVSPAYYELGRIGVEAGVTALPYESTPFGAKARVVWGALVMMWGPSSALYSCPVAMTDGAARTLLVHGGEEDQVVAQRLISRDFGFAWTSGQWMTETAGGSDVSRTGTIARRDADGIWRLYGTKWFTSATTSEMALTLARPEGAPEGSRGLAMFRIHRYLDDGSRNAILVRRLKDKLGTRALPTAELELEGAVAHPIGDPLEGHGVRKISVMLNITRIHNSIGGTSGLGRGLAWARAYAAVREAFGSTLERLPAHRATLTDLAVDHAACMALTLRCCELMGKVEHGQATDEDAALLRGLTPLTKLATGRWSIAGVTEAMEAVGGVGYCEDSTIPAIVRNAHVIPIWEGTTNVMALDFLRATRSGALDALVADATRKLEAVGSDPASANTASAIRGALKELVARAERVSSDEERSQAEARSIALGLATSYACALLAEQGAWASARGDRRTAAAAARLVERGLTVAPAPSDLSLGMDEPA